MSQSDSTSIHKTKKSLLSPLVFKSNQYQKVYEFFIEDKEEIQKITLNLSSKIKLVDAISQVLQQLSREHPLDENPNNYDIYISKKNGKPKTDFPSFQTDLTLEATGNNNFSLVPIAFQELKPKRKSTFDISNHYSEGMLQTKRKSTFDISNHSSEGMDQKQNEMQTLKKDKNWLLKFLGCL